MCHPSTGLRMTHPPEEADRDLLLPEAEVHEPPLRGYIKNKTYT